MRELASGRWAGMWWRLDRRTHGVALGVNWPSRKWKQWQISVLIVDLSWGRSPDEREQT